MKQNAVTTETKVSTDDAYHDARTLQSLREAERGEGITVTEARARMEARIAEPRSQS